MPVATINGHQMYYEVHGSGPPALCMGGWGTYCHGGERHLARGLTDRYSVAIFDHRGIGDSDDDASVEPTMRLYAGDVAGLLDHLGWKGVHIVGLVGMGACIGQELAIARPDLVRSHGQHGHLGKARPAVHASDGDAARGASRARLGSLPETRLPVVVRREVLSGEPPPLPWPERPLARAEGAVRRP